MALTAAQRRRAQRSRRFTPFKPVTKPPSGMYDPALDSGERAAQRGYGDLQQDTDRTRQLADLMKARQREGEDYGFRTSELGRQFGELAANQTNSANAAGLVGTSGYDALATQNRGANQRREQGQLDVAHRRSLDDFSTNETRVGEDASSRLGQMNLTGGRQIEDLGTTQERAGRELGFYGQDVNQQRFFQAGQAGYVPPTKPSNEGSRFGVTYQRQQGGSAVLPSGRLVSSSGLRNILKRAAQRRGVAYH
jgi:hypothetical protein